MLRTRLFLNLLPFLVILLAMGVYAIALFSRLADSVDITVTKNYRNSMAAQSMSLALAGMEKEAWATIGRQNTNSAPFIKFQKRFEAELPVLIGSASLPGEKELDGELVTNYDAFKTLIAALGSTTDADRQHLLYDQQLLPDVLTMNALLEKSRDLNHRAILTTSQNIQKITRDVTRLMIIGMAVALVISTYACYQLSRSILEPIQLLTKATHELGTGTPGPPIPVLSRDELGQLALAFNRMAAQLQEYRQSTAGKIVRLHQTMETTLASFPDPIFVLDKQRDIELKNPAAEELLTALQLNGLPARLRVIAQKTFEIGDHFLPHSFKEVICYRINGSEKFYLPRVLAMRDKDNALFGVAVVLYDVTRFRLLDDAKTNLVATVSHELKTPMTSVRMALYILLEGTVGLLAPKQEELLEAARKDTDRVLRILNDLLDLARLEEGAAGLHREKVSPAELVQTVAEETADKAAAKGVKLECSVAADLPEVSVDRQRIRHVFTNFINNAVKHSPVGGQIRLCAVLIEENNVEFSVTDEGPGIPEEYQRRIFDRFFRVPGQSKTGAGLGLSIAREISVAHGGRIGVRSSPGHGSTFFVALKAVTSSAA